MADYRTIPAAELGKGSNIKVELCETEVDLYWKMAIEVLELIQENNAKGEKTVMIVPYGACGPSICPWPLPATQEKVSSPRFTSMTASSPTTRPVLVRQPLLS